MKKNFLLLLLFLTVNGLFAQIKFEKGYFISNAGQKTDCYIKNVDWINNPTSFNYKLTMDSEVKTAKLTAVKSFVIPNICKYEKHTVNIDMSTKDYAKLNYDKNPEWKEKTVFLNVLIEGKATLYRYKNAELSRFFYKKGDAKIKQLVHKDYLSKDGQLVENNEYRQQLYTDLVCESISRNKVANLNYNRNDLTRFFSSYNSCRNNNFISYKQRSKGEFHVRAELGIMSQKALLTIGNNIYRIVANNYEIGQQLNPRFGVDLEYVLPFNKNKWAAFISPYYESFKGEGTIVSNVPLYRVPDFVYKIEYASIQIPIGIRHYMFLSNKSKIFINAGVVVDIPLKTNFEANLLSLDEAFRTSAGGVFGIGYNYKNYFAEARITTARELLENSGNSSLKLNQLSFIIGYRIF